MTLVTRLGTFWTIPNILSLSRAVLAVPVTAMILQDAPIWLVTSLLAVCAATDWFDGRLARRHDSTTEWGKVLDPAADKVAVLAIGTALVVKGILPLWLLSVVVIRDVILLIGAAFMVRMLSEVPASSQMGKAAAAAIFVTFLASLMRVGGTWLEMLLWITAALIAISFVQYAHRFLRVWLHVKQAL